jgi:hypothetical protein
MTINDTEIEEVLMELLQKDLRLSINNKQYRKGKLLLFKQNNYHLELTVIKNDTDMKRFEIPIPFGIEKWKGDGLVYFDYRLSTLSKNDKVVGEILKNLPTEGNNKFYNKILEIQIVEGE